MLNFASYRSDITKKIFFAYLKLPQKLYTVEIYNKL